jgi:hypothetical protein
VTEFASDVERRVVTAPVVVARSTSVRGKGTEAGDRSDSAAPSEGQGRLEGFSDAVFALAATLLVVTLEVPADYDDLLDALGRFPAFGLAFAALISLWVGHRQLFARYPLGDTLTVVINSVLLFVVLLYVYPLVASADLGLGWGSPIWLLLVGSPLIELARHRHGRRRGGTAGPLGK